MNATWDYSAAISAGFMAIGANNTFNTYKSDPSAEFLCEQIIDYYCGYCGFIEALTSFAGLASYCQENIAEWPCPGVFDYEVSEPFGKWWARQHFIGAGYPTQAAAIKELIHLISLFYVPDPRNAAPKQLMHNAAKRELLRQKLIGLAPSHEQKTLADAKALYERNVP